MRKMRCAVLAMLLITVLLGGEAFAADKVETSGGWVKDWKELEKQIKYYTDVCAKEFTLSLYNTITRKINEDFDCFSETVQQNGVLRCQFSAVNSGALHKVTFFPEYYPGKRCAYAYTSGNTDILSEDEKQLLDRALEIAPAFGGTDEETVRQIHDYICDTVSHYQEGPEAVSTAADALIGGEAVCSGYADAFYLLCSLKGIDAAYIPGKYVNGDYAHIWNAVRLDEKWYMLDAESADRDGTICYMDFLVGTDMMASRCVWSAELPMEISREPFARTENPFIEVGDWDDVMTAANSAFANRLERLSLSGLDIKSGMADLTGILTSLDKTERTDVQIIYGSDRCEIIFYYPSAAF